MDMTAVPHLDAPLVITDGGLETTLIFDDGIDVPHFASFALLDTPEGRAALDRYTDSYIEIAQTHQLPLIIETATWRASSDWGELLGYSINQLAELNRYSVTSIVERVGDADVVVSGCLGPRGDGYVADTAMSVADAAEYHRPQIQWLSDGGAHLVSALTMTNVAEATGIALAARDSGVACVISFTVETDGSLPSGETLADAIERVDLMTDSSPAYYMINCAHPTHFDTTLEPAAWTDRIRGIRSNASTMSHAQLDNADELDAGDPVDLAARYVELRRRFPNLTIFGGCCGTTTAHVAAAARTLVDTLVIA